MRFIQTWKMYERIPMKSTSILPDEGFEARPVELAEPNKAGQSLILPVYCKPKPAVGVRWGHRVMVMCDCGKHVPFGRMGQHYPAHKK